MNPNRTAALDSAPPKPAERQISFFERYLSVWVALCMAAGILLGKLVPSLTQTLREIELGQGSQVNLPIAILIWLMINADDDVSRLHCNPKCRKQADWDSRYLLINWIVKPFSMALLASFFVRFVFARGPRIELEVLKQGHEAEIHMQLLMTMK